MLSMFRFLVLFNEVPYLREFISLPLVQQIQIYSLVEIKLHICKREHELKFSKFHIDILNMFFANVSYHICVLEKKG